ncbi:MAG: hypothetical protein NTZ80_01255 [Patescibacteria group bacterium]|nr:hypothetical protein [Patescibacteria group bacterium]
MELKQNKKEVKAKMLIQGYIPFSMRDLNEFNLGGEISKILLPELLERTSIRPGDRIYWETGPKEGLARCISVEGDKITVKKFL